MNKLIIVIGGVIVLAVLGYVLLGQGSPQAAVTKTDTPTQTMEDQAASGNMKMRHSLRELLGMNMPLKCTFQSTDAGVTVQGTSYVAGGKSRTDMILTTREPQMTFTIMDSEYIYTWGDTMPQGMKMKLSDIEAMANTADASAYEPQRTADMDEMIDYDCAPWSVDTSIFVPPSGVEFMDYGEMMKGVQGMMQGLGSDAGMMEGMEAFEGMR